MEYRESRYFNRTECDVCGNRGPCHWCGRDGFEQERKSFDKKKSDTKIIFDFSKNPFTVKVCE